MHSNTLTHAMATLYTLRSNQYTHGDESISVQQEGGQSKGHAHILFRLFTCFINVFMSVAVKLEMVTELIRAQVSSAEGLGILITGKSNQWLTKLILVAT